MTAATARPSSMALLSKLVNQTAHGLSKGHAIVFDGTDWILALADTPVNCESTCIVSLVVDADSFYLTQQGEVTGISVPPSPYTPGQQMYLSTTSPGQFTATKPTGVGQVRLECFMPLTTTSGLFFGGSGEVVEPDGPATFTVTTTTPINMARNNGYAANGGSATTYVLPATYAVGDTFEIVDHSGFGFVITQTLGGVNQRVFDLGLASTVGTTGTTTTTVGGQSITLQAIVADGALRVIDNKGAFTYA